MLDILDVISEATKEANSFENHAAKDLTLEERLLYLQGLALVMNADGEIHQEEKEYIRILIKSFEMDESILESFVEFAQRPDKDTVQAFFRTFRRRPIAQLFLFDALMMTRRDDSVDDREKAVVDKIAEQLEVLKGTYQDIFELFCHLKNKDWDESSVFFSSHLLNPNHFKHLLDYYEVDFDELMIRTNEIRKDKLIRIVNERLNLVFSETIKIELKTDTIIPMLQQMLDRGELRVSNDMVLFSDGSSLKLEDEGINYELEGKYFYSSANALITAPILNSKFLELLDVNKNEDYKKLFSNVLDKVSFGELNMEDSRVLDLSRPINNEEFVVFDGKLWICNEGRYGFNESECLYNLNDNFKNCEGLDEIRLDYNIGDSDNRGYLRKISL
ncbi:TerB family tellurite resistance protein [Vibrio atlanticus]|nr:TerB family tellurite resistance protein [Vibrio atlanticus]